MMHMHTATGAVFFLALQILYTFLSVMFTMARVSASQL